MMAFILSVALVSMPLIDVTPPPLCFDAEWSTNYVEVWDRALTGKVWYKKYSGPINGTGIACRKYALEPGDDRVEIYADWECCWPSFDKSAKADRRYRVKVCHTRPDNNVVCSEYLDEPEMRDWWIESHSRDTMP